MKFTQLPTDTFQNLQINAGVLASAFTPATGTLDSSALLGATSGGLSFTATPTYKDFGEDIDNCPKNTKELKQLVSVEAKASGTFTAITTAVAKQLMAAADIDATVTSKVVPRVDLAQSDFADIWIIGDYSDKNGPTNGGFVAIRLIDALSTGGFSLQTADKDKGKFKFEFTAHASMSAQTVVPYEVYVKAGTAEPAGT